MIDIKIYFGKERVIDKMLKKNILKHTALDEVLPNVYPAKKSVPDWYKDADRLHNGEKEIKELPAKLGFKYCGPFGDSFLTGYMIPLSMDIAVKQTEGGPSISWSNPQYQVLSLREQGTNPTLPTPNGYSSLHFTWFTQNMIKLPKGYSALFTHPLNRFDLPFITLSGIVDGEFVMQNGNVPVFFNTSFEGIIPAGTPIVQIIPFKRESWVGEVDHEIIKEGMMNQKRSSFSAYGWYKQNKWKKKIYE